MQNGWRSIRNFIIAFLLVLVMLNIYFRIRDEIGARQNNEIISELSNSIKQNREKLIDFARYLDSINKQFGVYELRAFKGDIKYNSNIGFDSSIVIEKSRMFELYNQLGVSAVVIEDTCDQQKIYSFYFAKFYPRNRSMRIQLYSRHICDSSFITRNINPEGLTWQFYYDSLFTIDSKETYY